MCAHKCGDQMTLRVVPAYENSACRCARHIASATAEHQRAVFACTFLHAIYVEKAVSISLMCNGRKLRTFDGKIFSSLISQFLCFVGRQRYKRRHSCAYVSAILSKWLLCPGWNLSYMNEKAVREHQHFCYSFACITTPPN